MSVYQQDEWSSQEYNSYWKNKIQQQDSTFQNLTSWNNQSALSVSKQFLMITANAAAVSESWSVYSNFRWEVNLCYDQDWYECVIRNQSQLFYSTWSYHVVKDFNFDDKNIYNVNSNQIQDNQNFSSDQKKSE